MMQLLLRTTKSGRQATPLLLSLLLAACGGGATQAKSADPPLEDPEPAAASPQVKSVPASSTKVKEGSDAIQRQDFAAAKKVLLEARAEAPKDPQAAFYLGVAQEGLGETAEAQKSYRAALELDPKLADASANLSALLLDAGNAESALPILEQALKTTPKHPGLLVNRALALEAAGRQEEALKAYAEALSVKQDAPELQLPYAQLLLAAGKTKEATDAARAAAQSDDPKLLVAVADVFGKLKVPAECVAALDKVLKSKPHPAVHVRRGVCRHEVGDDPGAQADYEAALKLDPRFAPAHYYLGMHYVKRDKKAALAHFKQAVDIDTDKGPIGKRAKAAADELKKSK